MLTNKITIIIAF